MNIIEYLKGQHEEARDVLDRIIAEDDQKEAASLVDHVSRVLRLHMQIEEKMVYPAASRAFEGDQDEEETVLESYEEHEVAKRCLLALEGTPPQDKRFVIRAKVLKGLLDKHMDEEEDELFPELEAKLGQSGIERLSEEIERKMSQMEAESAPHPAKRRAVRTTRARATAGSRGSRAGETTRRRVRAQGTKSRGARSRASTRSSRKRH
jgi:hemerythrin-like domain-containing protein